MPQFPLCSEFIPLLDTVKNQLAELKVLSQEFLSSGNDETKREAFLKAEELEKTKQQLIDLKKWPTDFEGKQIPRIEKELMLFFRSGLGDDLQYQIDKNRVISISISGSTRPAKTLESVLKFGKAFFELQGIHCGFTEITNLPELPRDLLMLDCQNAPIAILPELPQSLRALWCPNTKITALPELPWSLEMLDCSSTQITELPELPRGLRKLDCHKTPAAKNPATKKQLEEFKKSHPGFEYEI